MTDFNSDEVQLKVHFVEIRCLDINYFNSDEVQLKGTFTDRDTPGGTIFQFRWGSIKRCLDGVLFIFQIIFQFRWGSIKSYFIRLFEPIIFNFNSDEVQLKGSKQPWRFFEANFNSDEVQLKDNIEIKEWHLSKFQFRWGSIKRNIEDLCNTIKYYFNSDEVQLKVNSL